MRTSPAGTPRASRPCTACSSCAPGIPCPPTALSLTFPVHDACRLTPHTRPQPWPDCSRYAPSRARLPMQPRVGPSPCTHRLRRLCAAAAPRPLASRAAPRPASHALRSTRQYATAFNQPLSFDTSKVTNMDAMFYVRSARALTPSLESGPPRASRLRRHRPTPCPPPGPHLAPHRMPSF